MVFICCTCWRAGERTRLGVLVGVEERAEAPVHASAGRRRERERERQHEQRGRVRAELELRQQGDESGGGRRGGRPPQLGRERHQGRQPAARHHAARVALRSGPRYYTVHCTLLSYTRARTYTRTSSFTSVPSLLECIRFTVYHFARLMEESEIWRGLLFSSYMYNKFSITVNRH